MPPVIIAAVAYYAGYITAVQLIFVAVAYTYSYDQQRTARLRGRREFNNSLKDRVVNIATVDGARSRVYGRARIADGVIFKGTHGDKNQYLTVVIALAGHEIDAVEGIYFNDQLVSLDGGGNVLTAPWSGSVVATDTITIPPGQASITLAGNLASGSISVVVPGSNAGRGADQVISYSVSGNVVTPDAGYIGQFRRVLFQTSAPNSKARVRAFLGSPFQNLSSELAADFPSLITSAHRFGNIAALVCRFVYDQDAYPTGVPTVSAVIRGARIFDPRDGQTRWTENPALIARDWALSPNGGSAQLADLDDASIIAAANACDVPVSFTTTNADGSSSTQTLPTYTAGLAARTDQKPDEVLAAIVNAMAGRWAWAGGRLRMRAGSYTAPVATITEDWVTDKGDIELVSTLPRTELVNVVTATIANKAADYVVAPIPRIAPSEYITADGGEYPLDLQLDAVTDVAHAGHVAGVMLREGRQALTLSLPCNLRALPLELFDVVAVTLPRFGFSAKPFEVVGWGFSQQGGIKVTLRETDASIYTVDAAFSRSDAAPNTRLPSPYAVPAISIASLASGTTYLLRQADGSMLPRLRVAWAAVQDEAVLQGGSIEVRYGPMSEPVANWLTATAPGGDTELLLSGVQDGAAYGVNIRARNRLVAGAWSLPRVHVVIGKSAPPSALTGLSAVQVDGGVRVAWDACADIDYADSEVRRVPTALVGTSWAWGDLDFVWRGAGSAYTWDQTTAGDYQLVVRHNDTSGTAGVHAVASVTLVAGGSGLLTLQASALSFTFDGVNAAAPSGQSIALTALTSGLSGTLTFSAELFDVFGASLGAATLGGSGSTRTLSVASFGAAAYCRVIATRGAGSDTLTIVRLRDGASALSGYLTNEAHTVATATDGSGGSYASAGGSFVVFNGATQLTSGVTYSVQSSSGITGMSINASGVYSLSGTSADVGTATLRATVGAAVIDKVYTIARSKSGAVGAVGPAGPSSALGEPLDTWQLNGQSLVTITDGRVGSQALRLSTLVNAFPRQTRTLPIDASRIYRSRFWARPSAAVDGNLYFSLRQFLVDGVTPGPTNSGRAPYKPANISRAAHEGQFGANSWGQYVGTWTAADWQAGAVFMVPEFLNAFGGTTGHWDIQGFELLDITEATAAQSAADAANATLGLIASDSVLHRSEKPAVILEWTTLSNEQAGIEARAAAFGITTERTAYSNAQLTLSNYLGGLSPTWNDLGSDTPIVGTTFRANFAASYAARQTLLNRIAEVAGTQATWSGVTGSGKPTDNATRNDIYFQAGDPGAVPNGSIWISSSTGRAWHRVSGAWQAYVGSSSIDTLQIFNTAITEEAVISDAAGVSFNNIS